MDRITTYQAALIIGLSPRAVQGYVASGKLRCWRAPSGHFQYDPADCAAFRRALDERAARGPHRGRLRSRDLLAKMGERLAALTSGGSHATDSSRRRRRDFDAHDEGFPRVCAPCRSNRKVCRLCSRPERAAARLHINRREWVNT